MATYISHAEKYFKSFSTKNIPQLQKTYSDNIVLKDWNGAWAGKQPVLDINSTLFNAVNILSITINEILEIGSRTYCHINIQVDENLLDVLDVIDWDENFQILKIEAFQG